MNIDLPSIKGPKQILFSKNIFCMFANCAIDGAHYTFMKTGLNSKISQISGFQKHLSKKSNLHIYVSQS